MVAMLEQTGCIFCGHETLKSNNDGTFYCPKCKKLTAKATIKDKCSR